jgi:protein-L-isoaspartate(D-aspartate) O-methyltransferase
MGAANVDRAAMPWARVEAARREVLGAPEGGPYDRILVSAEADDLPPELLDQLSRGGIMVIPVEGRMLRVRSTAAGPEVETSGYYRFVPLVQGP